MSSRQVLFLQGGGRGVHDDWDGRLVDGLSRELGADYTVRYPRMPDEDDPSYGSWIPMIRRELAELPDGAVVVGHSVGATLLMASLAAQPPEPSLETIVLLAAPFVGDGGWTGLDFEIPTDCGGRLPEGIRVYVFQGLDDQTVPPSHADVWGTVIPQAMVRSLPGRDHQLNNDLREVAEAVRSARSAPHDRP